MLGLREFTTAAEMREFYRDLRARFGALKGPPPKPAPPAPPASPVAVVVPAKAQRPPLTAMQRIILAVAEQWRIAPHVIRSPLRTQEAVQARGVVFYLGSTLLGLSTTKLGNSVGQRDHSTVIHAIRTVQQRMSEDAEFAYRIEMLTRRLLEDESR